MRILDLLRTRRIAARSFLCCAAIAFQWASIPAASAVEATGLSEDGDALRAYPVNGVPLLDSFLLQFSDNDDHNVQALTVWPGSPIPGSSLDCGQVTPGSIFLSLRDDDSREPFFFQVSHVARGCSAANLGSLRRDLPIAAEQTGPRFGVRAGRLQFQLHGCRP